ncbi:MAG: protease B nonderepressible form, partial [Chrysothrix sp. TS-e1954]
MKRRISYMTDSSSLPNPDSKLLQINSTSLSIQPQPNHHLHGAKEDRITLALDELPVELTSILKQCRELHIRWASDRPYEASTPFASRISPGLHVFVTPEEVQTSSKDLCNSLKELFGEGIKCSSFNETFTPLAPLSARFSHSTTHQYYSALQSPTSFLTHLASLLPTSSSLSSAPTTFDLSYTSLSHSLTVSTFHAAASTPQGWNDTITSHPHGRTEIGILFETPSLPSARDEEDEDAHAITLSGGLLVLGESEKFAPTLFSTPSRHHIHPARFSASFKQPTGLHPTLALSFPDVSALKPPTQPAKKGPNATADKQEKDQTCALHTHLTLPSSIFIDKYAFRDDLLLSSHNLASLRSLTGPSDLELPDWKIPSWGSAALFEITPPPRKQSGQQTSREATYQVTIPLHARYLPPSRTSGYAHVPIPVPVVFWACTSASGTKFATDPFDRAHLGYEGLFGERTVFYHLRPVVSGGATGAGGGAGVGSGGQGRVGSGGQGRVGSGGEGGGVRSRGERGGLTLDLKLPVLNLSPRSAAYIEPVTVAVVLVGFA